MTRAMKDSGIEWIGMIPEHWNVIKAKYIIMQNDGGVWGDEPIEGLENKIVLRSTEQTIDGKWNILEPATRYLNNIPYKAAKIKKGDLLITKSSGSSLHIGKTTLADEYFDTHECYYSNFLQRIHPNNKILAQYLWYIYNSPISREQFVYHQNSTIGIGNINSTDIENIIIPLPKREEQYAIITYLDKKCGEIDAITAKIQEQITTLEEYKKSVISEAVTKGLNPSAPMKNTSNQYWNVIPRNWKLSDIKYLFEIIKRIAEKEGFDILSVTQRGLKIKDISNNEGQIANNYSGYQLVYPTDYVMNHMDLLTGWVDCSKYFGVTSPDYRVFRLRNKENDLTYYKYVFQCCYLNKIFYSLGAGVSNLGRWRLQTDSFNNFMIPVPPIEEQKEIAEYLDAKCTEIENTIEDKQKQIETLEEYKKTLIYEYVTGKKEIA